MRDKFLLNQPGLFRFLLVWDQNVVDLMQDGLYRLAKNLAHR